MTKTLATIVFWVVQASALLVFFVPFAWPLIALWAVSRAPLAKLQAYKRRMEWTFPWASSLGSDFNFDFNVSFTEEQQRGGRIEYNYE